ncbi:MAG TPA: 2-oxo-4-hydroxy-4-carboxy-5-ureidoimidazoline decarboxylase [Acidobacteriaceae bacterium]|nr:2-oxo-4-hydroxy-4-carboxy-5-ureidoimidazoline decarboxylase [Acidobacteriaceae bacterium]
MRSHPAEYEMVSPGTLNGVLQLMKQEPGQWLPVAGATEVMVLFSAGKLGARKLVNLWGLRELREIREEAGTLTLGGGCTFSEIRECAAVQKHFPLLALAASWTGGIANQNRATMAGNIANASPAADSPPALLAYDAELELGSAQGRRRIPYREFHLAYKKTVLHADELIVSIRLKKNYDSYFSWGRKTGARNAQAISKVCIAAVGRFRNGLVEDVRIGMGAVAPVPLHLNGVEEFVRGKALDSSLIREARRALDRAISPIDDIRSVAEYRRFVAGNLLEEFLSGLAASGERLSPVLARWNALPQKEAAEEILSCCGSQQWARELVRLRPFADSAGLFAASDRVWWNLGQQDWDEAFRSHPRIGERKAPATATTQSAAWSSQEQNGIQAGEVTALAEIAALNADYEAQFGRVFLACATGRSATEMLAMLKCRLGNDAATELREAAEQQRQITQLRLRKWLGT